MKILKKGRLPEDKEYKFNCNYCGAVFVCQQLEAKYNSDQRDGDFLSHPCPTCQRNCTVSIRRQP